MTSKRHEFQGTPNSILRAMDTCTLMHRCLVMEYMVGENDLDATIACWMNMIIARNLRQLKLHVRCKTKKNKDNVMSKDRKL